MTNALRRLLRTVPIALVLPLAACAGHNLVDGKVIEGKVSYVGLVDPNDERLAGPGLQGATISARTVVSGQPGVNLGQATSDAKGTFHLTVHEQTAFSRPTEFVARKDGYNAAMGAVPFPPSDKRVLVILQPEPNARP